ncbi:MAG: helix-turn-helix domain-containing protein [Defluviitaleaceae bacterium]|nr:helix-turn-helix domain-containing protein [Defluviitaleaceae bacterium]
MFTYKAGDFIKRERERRGISQEDLAEPQMRRETLSKIERGAVAPSKKNLDILLEKLGYNSNNLPYLLLDANTVKFQETTQLIDTYLGGGQVKEAEPLIKELEQNSKFMKSIVNQQYLFCVKAASLIVENENKKEIEALLEQAIAMGNPEFSSKYLKDYYLSAYDLKAVTMLAIQYARDGKLEQSIELLETLLNNVEEKCFDKIELGRHYPYLAFNLSKRLLEAKEYEKAIIFCERGMAMCKKTSLWSFSPLLGMHKIYCLYELGELEKCKDLIHEIYYTLGHLGRDLEKANLKKFAQKKLEMKLN